MNRHGGRILSARAVSVQARGGSKPPPYGLPRLFRSIVAADSIRPLPKQIAVSRIFCVRGYRRDASLLFRCTPLRGEAIRARLPQVLYLEGAKRGTAVLSAERGMRKAWQ